MTYKCSITAGQVLGQITGYPKHFTYWGQTLNGEPSGKGRMISKDGFVYNGSFLRGLRHGAGILDYPDSDFCGRQRYFGEFLDGESLRKGIWTFKDGSTFEGELNSNMTGRGKMFWKNGTCFIGDFVNCLMHGHGTMTFALEDERANYSGDFQCGQMSGKGWLFWKDGANYSGTFQGGQIHGQGTIYFGKNESSKYRKPKAGPFSPNRTLIHLNKTGLQYSLIKGTMLLYKGDFKTGKISGNGAIAWQDGSTYIGECKEGQRHGNAPQARSDSVD